ncbi:MAG TPA: molybdopterin biosynthesis protein [Polyangia bacterium]|nr:molybdopterin biosynthesis protein [Polyangia bacterium]
MRKPRYLRMMDAGPAWAALRAAVRVAEPRAEEEIPVEAAAGRIAAAPVHAAMSSPSFQAAAMDGFAVRAADTEEASEAHPIRLALDRAARPIDTGDPIPDGFDAVVKIEDVQIPEGSGEIEITRALVPWHNVRLVGEDIIQGDMIVARGRRITPFDLGALLSAGLTTVRVRRRPRVVLLPTGDEIVEPGSARARARGAIIEFNTRMLAGMVEEWGGEPVRLAPIRDDPAALEAAVRAALAHADCVVVNAGSSAGADDYTPDVIGRVGRLLVHGVNLMPGKPTVLGVTSDGRALLGLPGYPVSCVVAAERFLAPLLAHLLGTAAPVRERVRALLARKTASKIGHEEVVRVQLARVGERYVAHPLGRGAGIITSLTRAAGLLGIDALSEGLSAGSEVEVELLRPRAEVDRTLLHVGSHDLALDLLADLLPARSLVSVHVGSIGGLVALGHGLCHFAGTHLIDPESGDYNLAYVRRYAGGRAVTLVELVRRQQGLIVAPGNPLGLRGLGDLVRPGVRFVNRQRGAGTRLLLDLRLAQAGLDAGAIAGYQREEPTHMAVAVAVQAEAADAGLGVQAAARALGLDFVPLEWERYDLALPTEELAGLGDLVDLVRSDTFRAAATGLGGYDPGQSGRIVAQLAPS